MRSLASISLILLSLVACSPSQVSRTHFIPTDDPKVGILEERDLQDEFGLGFTITEQEGIGAYMLSLGSYDYVTTRLEITEDEGQKKLRAYDPLAPERTLLTFDLTTREDGRMAIDFSSAANSLELRQAINESGGSATSWDGSSWITVGQPETLRVMQDADTFVADLRHHIQFQNGTTVDANGQTMPILKDGTVTVRVALRRLATLTTALPRVNKADAYQRNFGFQLTDYNGELAGNPIQRYGFDPSQRDRPQIHYYLKDFPAEYIGIAREAVLQWNTAFGWNAITVDLATEDMNIGDPRVNVIRWIEDGDDTLGYAGLEIPGLASKQSGATSANSILINGGYNIKSFLPIIDYSEKLKALDPKLIMGRIGNVPVHLNCGETPLLPFVTDVNVASGADYLHGYYFRTIMHEVGHSLGLTHNFKASTELEATNGVTFASSVMDYAPRWVRNRSQGLGSYDIAAIRWGYLQEESPRTFAFCDDEMEVTDLLCNRDDWGNPLLTVPESVQRGVEVLSTVSLPFPESLSYGIMQSSFHNLFKLRKLAEQIPTEQRAQVVSSVESILETLRNVQPPADLSPAERTIVQSHIDRLRSTAESARTEVEEAPVLGNGIRR